MAWNIVCIPKSVVDLVLNKWSRWMRPSWRRQPGASLQIHKLFGQMFVIWNIKQVVLVQINYRMGLIHGEVYRRVRNSSLRVELGFVNPTVTGRGKVTTDESFSSLIKEKKIQNILIVCWRQRISPLRSPLSGRKFGNWRCLNVLNIFFARHDRLLTNLAKARRGLQVSTACPVCRADVEDELHVLRDCVWARPIWAELVLPVHWSDFTASPLFTWLHKNLQGSDIGKHQQMFWSILFAVTVHQLRAWPNKALHNPLFSRLSKPCIILGKAREINNCLDKPVETTKKEVKYIRWVAPIHPF